MIWISSGITPRSTTPEPEQYTSFAFGRCLRESGVLGSMGSVADAFDNAMVETFFATLKTEPVYRRSWPTRHELEVEVFSSVEGSTIPAGDTDFQG